ncbi:hypothetical protein [Methanoculleus sp. UBA45]|jgi:hypothetical protein|uniref:hypothetical protein n=1 Tax=Methanoculleus sp. UBA45 TaxID=1915512 RepID=UPI0031BB2EFE
MGKIPPTPVTVTDKLLCDAIDGQKEIINELRAIRTEIRGEGKPRPRRLKEPKE